MLSFFAFQAAIAFDILGVIIVDVLRHDGNTILFGQPAADTLHAEIDLLCVFALALREFRNRSGFFRFGLKIKVRIMARGDRKREVPEHGRSLRISQRDRQTTIFGHGQIHCHIRVFILRQSDTRLTVNPRHRPRAPDQQPRMEKLLCRPVFLRQRVGAQSVPPALHVLRQFYLPEKDSAARFDLDALLHRAGPVAQQLQIQELADRSRSLFIRHPSPQPHRLACRVKGAVAVHPYALHRIGREEAANE